MDRVTITWTRTELERERHTADLVTLRAERAMLMGLREVGGWSLVGLRKMGETKPGHGMHHRRSDSHHIQTCQRPVTPLHNSADCG